MRSGRRVRLAGTAALFATVLYLSAAVAYLLVLLVAAVTRRQPVTAAGLRRLRFLVLVPAHDEAGGIQETVESLRRLDHPTELVEVVVAADNCSDDTAAIARSLGARVLERCESQDPGKGRALAWALERLVATATAFDVLVVVDADCTVSPNLLSAVEARVLAGAQAVQTNNLVRNPCDSTASALRFAGFSLINTIRPRGKSALGLSVGLQGTGMAFTRAQLERDPWSSFTITEDQEQGLRIVAAGGRVCLAPEAAVSSRMPTSFSGSASQQTRWESGRIQLVARWAPRLIGRGLSARSPQRLHAGLELLVPPQSLLAVVNAGVAVIAGFVSARRSLRLALLGLVGQLVFVLGGLVVVRAPLEVFRALLAAPLLAAQKMGLVGLLLMDGAPSRFVRTPREASVVVRERA